TFEDLTAEHFDRTLKANLYGYFYMTKAAVPHMKPGSAIVMTGSVTGILGNKDLLDYSMTIFADQPDMKLEQEVRHRSEDIEDAVLLDAVQAIRRRVRVVSRAYERVPKGNATFSGLVPSAPYQSRPNRSGGTLDLMLG